MGAWTLGMFTGPEEVEILVDRIRAVHFIGDSTEDSREFLTANPTRHVCVVRLAPFPVGRVYSDSLGLPFD